MSVQEDHRRKSWYNLKLQLGGDRWGRDQVGGTGGSGEEESWGKRGMNGREEKSINTQNGNLSEGKTSKTYRSLKFSRTSYVYEPKLIRPFWEIIHKFSVLTMNMKEEETDEVRI